MKLKYLKILTLLCIICCIAVAASCTKKYNSLTYCKDNLLCAEKISGTKFPLVLSNFNVSAMTDLIEITYPLDEFRDVTIRKTTQNLQNQIDIDRNYEKYPISEILSLENGVNLKIKRDKESIYVAYLTADSGYYSIFCPKGITENELWQIYNVIAEVEAE